MNDDWRVVYESLYLGDCSDRALVLESAKIPHEIIAEVFCCPTLRFAQKNSRPDDAIQSAAELNSS